MTLLVKDTFVGVNGTALTAHTPDTGGGTWVIVEQGNGVPTIQANSLKLDGGAGNGNETSVALPKSGGYGTNDYIVTGTVNYVVSNFDEQFITARVDTAAGAYKKYTFGWYRSNFWQLRKYYGTNGQYTVLAQLAAGAPAGAQTLVMRVVTSGGNAAIQCKVGSTVIIATTTDSTAPIFTTGIAGVVGWNQSAGNPPATTYTTVLQVDTIPTGAQDVLNGTPPAGAVAATAFGTQPAGTIADAYGAAVTGQADTITASVVSGPGAISGTLTAAVNTGTGAWTFTNLQLSLAGTYVLKFASTNGYAPATATIVVATKTANFAATFLGHAMSDAGMTFLDGAILEIRDGAQPANVAAAVVGTVGARITFESPGTYNWGTPYGVTVVLPSASVVGLANITPTWARLFKSDGTTGLMDVTAAPGGVLVLSAATISTGQRVQLEALVLYDPGFTVSLATAVSGEVAIGGTVDGKAEEPRVYVDTTPPTTTVTKTVGLVGRDYSDLQTAVTAAAASGASWKLLVDAGYDYTPPGGAGLLLPAKTGTNWVVITPANLPAAGTRVTPTTAASFNLPKVRLNNLATAITTTSGSTYYRLQGLEVLPITSWGGIGEPNTLVNVQPDNNTFAGQGNSYADMPHHIVIDRCYIHGSASVNVKNGVPLHGDNVALIDSYVSEIHADDAETHGVLFYMQKGPVRVTNNYIEGTGQSILVGGAESVWPGVCLADIEIRYNTLAKDPAWNGVWHDIKTIMEMKAGRRCLIEGNEVKYNWNDPVAAWRGATFTFKTVSQNGSATVGHWRCSDVIMRNNRLSYSGVGFNLHPLAEPSKPATPAARFTYRNNLVMHMADYPAVPVTKWAMYFDILPRVSITDLTVDHCTFVYPSLGALGIYLGDYGSPASNGGVAGKGYVRTTIKNSIFATGGDYQVYGRDYLYVDDALAYYLGATSTLTRNVFSGGITAASGSPVSAMGVLNTWLVNTSNGTYPEIGFTSIATDNYALSGTSPYRAAGNFPALDATDLGVNMTVLTAALAGIVSSPGLGVAAQLAFITQPGGAVNGQPLTTQPAVAVRDSNAATVTSDTRAITLRLVPVAGAGDLLTPAVASATGGIAAFSGVAVTAAVGTFLLRATSPGLPSVDSLPFSIGSPVPTAQTQSTTQRNFIEAMNAANSLSGLLTTWEVPLNDPVTHETYKITIATLKTLLGL